MKQKGFRNNVRKRIIQKSLKNNKRSIVFPSLDLIRTIGIVKEIDIGFDFSTKRLTGNSRLVFLNLTRDKIDDKPDENLISLANLNFWGLPAKAIIESFVSEPFDLLINFIGFENNAVDLIFAKSKAKFKAGTTLSACNCDLIIDQQIFDGSLFIDELEKAFSNFNTPN